jgi:hypothetical protein
MSKQYHVLALAFTGGAAFPSEIATLANFESFAKARDWEFDFLRIDE